MVIRIENAIKEFQPDYVFTHNPSDINSDHYWCSKSCQEAVRYAMRGRYESKQIKGFYYFEVLSSTDWYSDTSLMPFVPDTFVSVSEKNVENKIKALECYENVLRDHPFPRNANNIFGLAMYRGAQCGYKYAEAFKTVWRRGL
jgi:LmbE family N-acetylglucosaminyl deacetylase